MKILSWNVHGLGGVEHLSGRVSWRMWSDDTKPISCLFKNLNWGLWYTGWSKKCGEGKLHVWACLEVAGGIVMIWEISKSAVKYKSGGISLEMRDFSYWTNDNISGGLSLEMRGFSYWTNDHFLMGLQMWREDHTVQQSKSPRYANIKQISHFRWVGCFFSHCLPGCASKDGLWSLPPSRLEQWEVEPNPFPVQACVARNS